MDQPASEQIVFVIDDDPGIRDSLKSLFESMGLQVQLFGSATAFLEARISDVTSCLVVDVTLPGLSGLEFQKALVKADIQIPIVFITGHGTIPMSVEAMKAGAVEFLTKPFRDDELVRAVHTALDRDRLRRQQASLTSALKERFASLTAREKEVFNNVSAGLLNKQIAAKLGLSEITVKVHRAHMMQKMHAHSLTELIRMADLLRSILERKP